MTIITMPRRFMTLGGAVGIRQGNRGKLRQLLDGPADLKRRLMAYLRSVPQHGGRRYRREGTIANSC